MAAVARCFPGKAKGGGDRKPDNDEIAQCGKFLAREVSAALQPELVLAVGALAIGVVLGPEAAKKKLDALVGGVVRTTMARPGGRRHRAAASERRLAVAQARARQDAPERGAWRMPRAEHPAIRALIV